MAGLQLGGLVSGMDTETIISSLLAIEAQPKVRLSLDQTAATTRQQALRDAQTRLKSLRTAAEDLGSVLLWLPKQSVTSADEAKIGARMSDGAAPGGYSVKVTQMASAAQRTYDWGEIDGPTTLEVNGVTVEIADGKDLPGVVAAINSNSALGVFAVKVGDAQLVLTSRTTGSAVSLTASGAMLTETASRAGTDAKYSIDDGPEQTSATNVVANALPGVELTLKGLTAGTAINVSTPEVDRTAVKDKLKAFVAAYNDAMDFMATKTREKKVVKEDGSRLTSAEAAQGALFGDLGLRNMMSTLRTAMTDVVSGLPSGMNALADLGITTGAAVGSAATNADSIKGRLVFDEKVFDTAFDEDPLGVQKLMGGTQGTAGLAQSLGGLLTPMVQANGLFDQRIESTGNELTRIKDAITRVDARLAVREELLRRQFTAMELALARSQAQTADLLAGLSVKRD